MKCKYPGCFRAAVIVAVLGCPQLHTAIITICQQHMTSLRTRHPQCAEGHPYTDYIYRQGHDGHYDSKLTYGTF